MTPLWFWDDPAPMRWHWLLNMSRAEWRRLSSTVRWFSREVP